MFNTGETDKLNSYIDYTTNLSFQRNGYEMAQETIDAINQKYEKIGTIIGIDESNGEYIEYTEFDAFDETCWLLNCTGFKDGLNMFADGIDNLFHADGITSANEYKTQYILSFINEKYQDKGKLAQWISTGSYEIFNSIGNMAPSMLVSMIPGCQSMGLVLMGASAAGNAKEKGLQMGMDDGAAWMYGILNGLSEAGLQYALGAIPGLSNMEKFAKLGGVKGFFAKMLSEGTEESLQSVLEPLFATIVTNGKIAYKVDWNEVLKSGIYGMITAGIMNGGQIVIGKTAYTLNNAIIDAMIDAHINKKFDLKTKEDFIAFLKEHNADEMTWEDEMRMDDSNFDYSNIKEDSFHRQLLNKVGNVETTEKIIELVKDDIITRVAEFFNLPKVDITFEVVDSSTLGGDSIRGHSTMDTNDKHIIRINSNIDSIPQVLHTLVHEVVHSVTRFSYFKTGIKSEWVENPEDRPSNWIVHPGYESVALNEALTEIFAQLIDGTRGYFKGSGYALWIDAVQSLIDCHILSEEQLKEYYGDPKKNSKQIFDALVNSLGAEQGRKVYSAFQNSYDQMHDNNATSESTKAAKTEFEMIINEAVKPKDSLQ